MNEFSHQRQGQNGVVALINDWRSPKYSIFRILKLTATLFYFNE